MNIIDNYLEQIAAANEQIGINEKTANKYSLQRLIVFGVLVFSIYLSVELDNNIWIFVFFLVVCVLWFSWLVSEQNKYDALRHYYTDLKKVLENEIASIEKNGNLYYNGEAYSNEKHFYSSDLDILGNGSLFQMINRSATGPGNSKLASWLLAPANKKIILYRQEAVKELAEKKKLEGKFSGQAFVFYQTSRGSGEKPARLFTNGN